MVLHMLNRLLDVAIHFSQREHLFANLQETDIITQQISCADVCYGFCHTPSFVIVADLVR
jgi:hypothetical protein